MMLSFCGTGLKWLLNLINGEEMGEKLHLIYSFHLFKPVFVGCNIYHIQF